MINVVENRMRVGRGSLISNNTNVFKTLVLYSAKSVYPSLVTQVLYIAILINTIFLFCCLSEVGMLKVSSLW